jgi:general secretion pathway protein K
MPHRVIRPPKQYGLWGALIDPKMIETHHIPSETGTATSRGFVLPLTLWIIALFGLGVASINTWMSTAVENARTLQQKAEAAMVSVNTENELVYAMATRPMSSRGLEVGADITLLNANDILARMSPNFESSNYVSFDGRPYALENSEDYLIYLQDGRGLLKLQNGASAHLRRLLALFDVPETLRNQLPDTLADWIDEDELTRLAGAEARDYERRRRLPPTNANLLTPMEAQSILGWDQIPEVWEADLRSPLFTTCRVTGFNPNTAPEAVLLSYVAGLTKTTAAQVIERRKIAPFRHAREFMAAAGFLTPAEPFFFSVTPSNCVIVDMVHRDSGRQTRFSLSLVPTSQNKPWQVDYAVEIPSRFSRPSDGVDPQLTFPAPETINPIDGRDNRVSGLR